MVYNAWIKLIILPKVFTFNNWLMRKYEAEAIMMMVMKVEMQIAVLHFLVLRQEGKDFFAWGSTGNKPFQIHS